MVGAVLARRYRRPLFVTQHVSLVQHDNPLVMAVQRAIYASVGCAAVAMGLAIVAYNVMVERFLVERGVTPGKVRLGFNGIDTTEFRPGEPAVRKATRDEFGLPQDKPVVLFAGRLVPKKGYRELIAAHHPDYEIVLAGPGEVPPDLPDGVTLTGPLDRDDPAGPLPG